MIFTLLMIREKLKKKNPCGQCLKARDSFDLEFSLGSVNLPQCSLYTWYSFKTSEKYDVQAMLPYGITKWHDQCT